MVNGLSSVRWWFLFVIASAALLYTHYFGVFLLLAYGMCFAIGWLVALARGRPHWRTLAVFALCCLSIALLYLPWLPAMLNRYAVDRSYWQGALKINEALRHVAISFTTGAPETMLERDAVRLLPWFGVALVVAAGALVWQGSRGSDARSGGAEESGWFCALVYLSTCLLLPILAVLLLASRTPKFNPRYLMLVSPAYLLILAGGIGALAGGRSVCAGAEAQGSRGARASRITHHAARITFAVILSAFLIATSVIGLHNWFTDPAFTKAQWRELAAAVRAQIAPDEAVLLVSGHASPAWDYYAPDIPRTRLPEIDILDVNAVLGFDAGAQLGRALAGKAGAWLVSWQDAVVDPAGFVPHFLDRAGAEQPVAQEFWHLGLRHWRLRPDATFPAEATPAHVQSANFDHKLALLGWDDPREDQLTVYWRVLNTLTKDYRVSRDPGGRAGPRGGPVGWPAGQLRLSDHPLAARAGDLRTLSAAPAARMRPRVTTPSRWRFTMSRTPTASTSGTRPTIRRGSGCGWDRCASNAKRRGVRIQHMARTDSPKAFHRCKITLFPLFPCLLVSIDTEVVHAGICPLVRVDSCHPGV